MVDNKYVMSFDDTPINKNSKIDSEKYNDMLDSMKTSVLRVINKYRTIVEKQNNLNKALVAENKMLSSVITTNESVLIDASTALVTGFDEYDKTKSSAIEVSALNGNVKVGSTTSWSKIPRYLNSNNVQRPSLDVNINLDGVTLDKSDSIYNIIDGNSDTFWLLDTVVGTTHNVVITFPTSIRPSVNSLVLTPFPALSFKTNAILVTRADGSYVNVMASGYEQSTDSGIDMDFKPTSWGNTISFQIEAQNNVIGISNLDVFLKEYYDSVASVRYKLDALKQSAFNKINKIELSYYLYGDEDDGLYEPTDDLEVILYIDGIATPIGKSTLLFDDNHNGLTSTMLTGAHAAGQSVEIEFKFKKYNGQTPIFNWAKITHGGM